ncbi:hypothetical protein F5884DRAFT_706320 [Xylogone sp. PMI_703]|nr:hypothetical protein F5884DRAFT_706320 [Xylogone sp. PMI_703]
MARSKPRNRNHNRADPISKPIKPPTDPELAAIREKRILPVLKDLQSAELKTRSGAASIIRNIIEDQKCRKLLLRDQIVRILFDNTLTDSNLETKAAGWSILSTLAEHEEADFCVHLYRQDVLTALEGVIKAVIQAIESKEAPISSLPQAQKSVLWNISISIVTLLVALCEAQDEIVQAITKQPIFVNFLFGLLAMEIVPSDIQGEAALCLQTLTEDNEALSQSIVDDGGRLKLLIALKDSGDLKGVAACGALHNIFDSLQWFDHTAPVPGASDASLIPTLVKYLDYGNGLTKGANGNATETNPEQILQLALEITASIATTLQEALEHDDREEEEFEGFDDKEEIAEEDDEMDDGEGEAENGEMNVEEIDADMDLVTGDAPGDNEDLDNQPTLERLVQDAAPAIVEIAKSLQSRSTEDKTVHGHALSALNNIAWTVSSVDFSTGHLNRLQSSWVSTRRRIWNEIISPVLASNTADIALAASITSLAWAVSRGAQDGLNIRPGEHQKFIALFQASEGLDKQMGSDQSNGAKKDSAQENVDEFQGLGVKCIGVLGRLALDPAPIEVNCEIGIFLLGVISSLPNASAANVVEALNQIFDIYADETHACDEAVFWKEGFYKQLEDSLPKVKQLAKSIDKRKHNELRARTDEAVLNLGRFLKYKRSKKAAQR